MGRTGAGKSSLVGCLLRTLGNLDAGRIVVDGVDIGGAPLETVFFFGYLRSMPSANAEDPYRSKDT